MSAEALHDPPSETPPFESKDKAVSFRRTVTVRRPVDELYAFWLDLENLPRFMRHLKSVTVTGPETSHWVADAPAGQEVSWDARITDAIEGRRIEWAALPDSQIENSGSVLFLPAPAGRGTEVTVSLSYVPPAGSSARRSPSSSARNPSSRWPTT